MSSAFWPGPPQYFLFLMWPHGKNNCPPLVCSNIHASGIWGRVGVLIPSAKGRKEMFYLTTHSTHFIYGYMASDIWLRTTQIAREETRCHHMSYSIRLAARVLLYAPSHRQDDTYHGLSYTSRGESHWLEREIVQWVHPMNDRSDDPSHHERTLLPRSYSIRLAARVLLYASSHRQDNTYHCLCYTSRGPPLAGTRNSSTGPHHEGSLTF